MAQRIIRRTPDLGLRLRLRRLPEPEPEPGPEPCQPITLGWWNPEAGDWSRTEEGLWIDTYYSEGRVVPALLVGATASVLWQGRWNDGEWWDISPDPDWSDPYMDGRPNARVRGQYIELRPAPEDEGSSAALGVLDLRAHHGGVTYGPITLVIVAGYY